MVFLKTTVKISFFHSIQVRVLSLVVVLMIAVTSLLSWYVLGQFQTATTFELEQEGILLSNALEAAISPLVEVGDIPNVQRHIDRLVAIRERNDIEINIIFLDGDTSEIVASNNPDNIEETSAEEHANLLASLDHQRPVILIEREEEDVEDIAENDEETEITPSPDHPDLYLLEGQRFLSITTPLIVSGRKLGSINVKLSLAQLDQELAMISQTILVAQIVALGLVIAGLVFLLKGQIFNPLQRMAEKMQTIAGGDLSQRVAHQGPVNEIGWLAHSFDQMIEKLQVAFNRERRFTADVSHELRTPLTALKGRIGVTLTQPRSSTEYKHILEGLEKEVDRLARLSNDLLFLTRLEQGQLRPRLEEQDLSDLLGAIIEQMHPLAEEKEITLIEQVPPELILQGDADHLIRLFINLIDNAIKYTPPGGEVKVQTECKKQQVLIKISDTGPGIPPEHLSFLFDRFYRVEADRARSSGGAGLGLAIAYEVARAHRGKIEVQSKVGIGTIFTVHLPAPS
jgi:heavy metal sensor kinase